MSVGYNPYINAASARFGVDPRLIQGVIALESSGNPNAFSPAGARGLMQVMPPTYAALSRKHGFGADMSDPENSIMAGTAYLSDQLKANGGDWGRALAAYNAGPAGSAKFRATGDFSALPQETRGYLQRAAQAGLLDPNDTPPVEVADRPVPHPVTATDTQSATAANGVAAGASPQSGVTSGLLSDPDAKATMLLSLGAGLLSGRNWAEGLAGAGQGALQAMQQVRRNAMTQRQLDMQTANTANDQAWRRMSFDRQLRNDERDQAWRQRTYDRQTTNDTFDQQYRRDALRIQEMNATKEKEPDIIAALRAGGIDPQSEEGRQYIRQKYLGGFGQPAEAATQDRAAQAQLLGVPLAEVDPYADPRLSPKGRENMRLAAQKAAERRWAEMDKQDASAQQTIQDMKRFMELNGRVDSGGAFGGLKKAVGGYLDKDISEMLAITARVAPQMRVPGSGATSDFDAKQFERATVGMDKPRDANDSIAKAAIARAQLGTERSAFERAYFEVNGHIQGADRAWGRYLNDNPIFDPKGEDFALNPNRKPWQQYFGGAKPEASTAAPKRRIRVDAQGNIISTGDDGPKGVASMSDDELLAKLGLKGGSVAPPPPAGYKVLKFDAQGNRIE